jgi:hypothetical protein
MNDPIKNPRHYTYGSVEVIDIIEGFGLEYHKGNVVKYILRAGHKEDELLDLKKARWYLDRYIQIKENENGTACIDPSNDVRGGDRSSAECSGMSSDVGNKPTNGGQERHILATADEGV